MISTMKKRQTGFTIVELMVALSIIAILSAIGGPSFVRMINSSRLAGQSNELLTLIQYARGEAIRINGRVTFCGTANENASDEADCADGKQPHWVVIGPDGQLRRFTAKDPVQVSSDVTQVTFGADGLARAGSAVVAANITVCIPTKRPPENRRIVGITGGSRVAITPAGSGEGVCP